MRLSGMTNFGFGRVLMEGEGAGGGTAPGTPPEGTPPAIPENAPWYQKAGVAQDHHEWLHAKQFADVNTALTSYRSLEGVVGRERLAVPKDATDTAALDAIYKTLGRPDKWEDYKLPEGSKIDGEKWKTYAPVFHKHGASPALVNDIVTTLEAQAAEHAAAVEVERANAEKAEIAAIEKEWGSALEANSDIAARAFRALGIDEATSDKIEAAIGYAATMKLFHNIGSGMSEAKMHQDGTKGGNQDMGGSLEGVKRQLDAKLKDAEFLKRYQNHDPRVRKEAIDEIEALQKQIVEKGGVKQP